MIGHPRATHVCPCDCGQQLPAGRVACPAGWARLPEQVRDAITRATAAKRHVNGPNHGAAVLAHRQAVSAALDWYAHHSLVPCASRRAARRHRT